MQTRKSITPPLERESDHRPVYLRIQQDLRAAIGSSAYKPADLLPSETELARRYATTRATVVHALQGLVFEGLIKRKQGLGTFVAYPAVTTDVVTTRLGIFEHDILLTGQRVTYVLLEFAMDPGTDCIRERLNLMSDDSVHVVRRLRLVNGSPLGLEVRYLPSKSALLMSEKALEELTLQDIFKDTLQIPLTHINNTVYVTLATPDVAKQLNLPKNSPVMVREHTQFSDKTPLLWGKTFYREEYQVRYTTVSGNRKA